MENFKPNSICLRKKRWDSFFKMDGKKSFVVVVGFSEGIPAQPRVWPDKKKERIEWAVRKYDELSNRMHWLDDDMIPHLDMFTGTEIFAEAFGCKVFRPEDDMPSARPLVFNAAEASRIQVPDVESSSLSLLFEIADQARESAGRDALVKLPDIQSPMDIAALIWNKSDFYTAMIDEPEAVRELTDKVCSLLTAFLDKWFARYGKEFIAHFPFYYMQSGVTLSEDEVGSMSPAAFREFVLPNLSRLADRYGGLGIHCCANSRHQWDNFTRIPGLRYLNLFQPGETLDEAVKFFAGHVVQDHRELFTKNRYFGGKPVWDWPQLVPEGVHMVLRAEAGTKAEAIEACRKLKEACG